MSKALSKGVTALVSLALLLTPVELSPASARVWWQSGASASILGQSRTLLPNGQVLIIGGDNANGPSADIFIQDLRTGRVRRLQAELRHSRTGHSATLLPDGRVLIAGGIGRGGRFVPICEVFDPVAQALDVAAGLTMQRAFHTATLLLDGRILVAGGISAQNQSLDSIESFDLVNGSSQKVGRLSQSRATHSASLLADGRVLFWQGTDQFGQIIPYGDAFDPASGALSIETLPADVLNLGPARVIESLPLDGAEDVSQQSMVALRFTRNVAVESVNDTTVSLQGPDGRVGARVVPAESGMLVFITPQSPLAADTTYSLYVNGVLDQSGVPLPAASIRFTTRGDPDAGEIWIPGNTGTEQDWHSNQPEPKTKSLPPLQAAPGATALSGQVLRINGRPLANVTFRIGEQVTLSDETGRFLLTNLTAGHHVLYIEGDSASRSGRKYCSFEVGVDIAAGQTNVYGHTIYLPVEDLQHATPLPVPTTEEVVATHPKIPGLEIRIPAGVILRTHHGTPLTYISITPVPVDRTPLPSPPGVKMPFAYALQAHGARVESVTGDPNAKVRIINPNFDNHPAGSRFDLWNYSARGRGWYVYGDAYVSADRKHTNPAPGVGLRYVNCFPGFGTTNGTYSSSGNGEEAAGDPVDLSSGLFVYSKTDLVLPDTIPFVLTRVYRPNDSYSRPFGIGSSFSYEMFISGHPNTQSDVYLPDGRRVHFDLAPGSPGNEWSPHTATPSAFYGATLTTNSGTPYRLRLKDGTTYGIGIVVRGITEGYWSYSYLDYIEDRYGNRLQITRPDVQSIGLENISRITTPNGRWVDFTYDSSSRITQVRDNINRTVTYQYDGSGRLWKVTDPEGGITEYTYDSSHRMLTIKDARGIVYLTNQYDSNGKVTQQTQADNGTYQYAYTLDPTTGKVTQTDVTDPRGHVRRVTFNSGGYSTSDTYALGQTEEQTVTYTRQSGTNLITRVTDELARNTDYTYDSAGNVLTVTRLAGTGNAVTTTFTYESSFNQVATVADPLSHTTTFAYDTAGNLTSVSDPLTHATTFTYNGKGQPLTVKDTLNNETSFAYDPEYGDLVTITDPLSRTTTRYLDAAGRLVKVTDPLGRSSRTEYDALNQVTKVVDPHGGQTTFTYDDNGNLLTVTDARSNTTTYTYDNMDRLATRTDPLTRQETFTYDLNGNLVLHTDRRGKVTTYTYDKLDRNTFVGFGTVAGTPPTYESTITTSYDAGNRATQVVDSASGTITLAYDNLDRLTSETTPQGTVGYTYDNAGRRATMTVPGQSTTSYSYDNADRLTGITRGTQSVAFTYDNADRRATMTLPNGIVVSYSYDNASQLTGMTYTLSPNTLGTLTYGYDNTGRRTSMGGTWARTNLPAALTSATYNAANQLTQWGSTSLSYDNNGNMTSDGTNTLTWDARNQLASMSGGVSASFQYDPFGRRSRKTISGTTTDFLYDGINPIQEIASGTPIANLFTGLSVDEYFTRTDAVGTHNFLTDALGSTWALANSSGSLLNTYTYEPFGNASVSGSLFNPMQFTGRENDGTGLFFYRARYFSPVSGRFLSEDPLELAGGSVNLYGYVHNNPISFSDPLGLYDRWDFLRDVGTFSEAFADTLTLGSASRLNDALGAGSTVNRCNWVHKAGTVAGIAFTSVVGGALGAQAARANANKAGFEFSHWLPKRLGGPRSIFNGNFVSKKLAYLTDPFRYPAPAGAALRWGPKLNPVLQQILRIPWVYDGAAAGAAYGTVGAMAGRDCGCQ